MVSAKRRVSELSKLVAAPTLYGSTAGDQAGVPRPRRDAPLLDHLWWSTAASAASTAAVTAITAATNTRLSAAARRTCRAAGPGWWWLASERIGTVATAPLQQREN